MLFLEIIIDAIMILALEINSLNFPPKVQFAKWIINITSNCFANYLFANK